MSEPQKIIRAPCTAQELLECGWVRRVRNAVLANGNAIGIRNGNTITAQCINEPEKFMPIMLPNGGTRLLDEREAMTVLDWLDGTAPIPEPPERNKD